jgi:hypothetical protein
MTYETSTGVLLEQNDMTRRLDELAKRQGLPICAAMAIHKNGQRFFVLIEGGEVIYENQRLEDTACHLNMQELARREAQ